jgi:membrane-bound lytic murein transglycosylase C
MLRRNTFLIIVLCLGSTLVLLGLLAGFVPQGDGPQLRRPVSRHVLVMQPQDMPDPIVSLGNGTRYWAVHGNVPPDTGKEPVTPSAPGRAGHIVTMEKGAVRLFVGGENLVFGEGVRLLDAPLLAQDGVSAPALVGMQPRQYGDVLDARGQPLRWRSPSAFFAGCVPIVPRVPVDKRVDAVESAIWNAIADDDHFSRARRYRQLVESFAGRYNLSTELVYAIIHSESDFSPTLVSDKSAMGLMQLLPSTASDEVHRFLYGRRGDVGFNDLREPETNIRYGTAYLHILLTRYFSGVRNLVSREYCAVAAYNMGPNRFLRLYGKTDEEAVAKINEMSAEALYVDLTRALPLRETRFYVAKVRRMKGEYEAF